MAGITIDELQKQTGSSNIIRIIPTGPDTICDETAIAGAYPQQDITDYIFDLLGFDVYNVKNEDELKYMSVAGCLPHQLRSLLSCGQVQISFDNTTYIILQSSLHFRFWRQKPEPVHRL